MLRKNESRDIMKKSYMLFIIAIFIFGLQACQQEKNPNWLDQIHITFDEETLTVTSETAHIQWVTQDLGNVIALTITIQEPFFVDQKTKLYVNDINIAAKDMTLEAQQILYHLPHPHPVDPESYVDVTVTFDPNGGVWKKPVFDAFDPEYRLTITAKNDLSGITFSLFDNAQTQLRWYYKLFLDYNEAYDAYEVVYKDASTASVLNLNLPAYDIIIGAHLHTTDILARDTMIALSSQDEHPTFVRFDTNPMTYTSGDLGVSIYTEDQSSGIYTKVYKDIEIYPVPVKDNFTFLGWSNGESLHHVFPRFQAKQGVKSLNYVAVWGSYDMEEVKTYIETLIPEKTSSNLSLPKTYSGYTITWESSMPEAISSEGVYKRPYQAGVVTLTATLTMDDQSVILSFDTMVDGYKSLEGPIASSYIYRNFDLVNDSFFETLDIINGAFVTAHSDGTITGAAFLANMENYILPQARIHGNWVIPSIAPESAWSSIAASSVKMNTFADEIVNLINRYGFDGVDIDWETPTTAEATRYTELMRIVYTKVKANNPNHLVTTAITGGQWQPPRYDLLNSGQYIDYINMMTYGMTNSGAQYHNALYAASTYHNLTFSAGRTLVSCSIDESVKMFKNVFHIPYSKIIVGAAFYGIRQVRSYENGAWTPWTNGGSVHYTTIVSTYLQNSAYIKAYDARAGVPYLLKTDGTEFISYDNPKSILEKSAYIIDQEIAGMMYWENGLDATGALLNAMREGLKG